MTITLTQLVVTVGLAAMIPTLTALIGVLLTNALYSFLDKVMVAELCAINQRLDDIEQAIQKSKPAKENKVK